MLATGALGAAVLLHALVAARALNVAPQASGFGPGTHSRGARVPMRASSSVPAGAMRPVVLCPAQFGTAEDYTQLKQDLRARGFDLYAAPLRRFDWFKIVPATLTMDFFTASLKPAKTLGFFYEALDKAFAQVEADYGPDAQVAVLGHSIGGWVARSYIGEQMGAELASRRVCSLVTLGTPHNPPPADSPMAALDQTRGLLTYINQRFPSGSPLPSTTVTVSPPPRPRRVRKLAAPGWLCSLSLSLSLSLCVCVYIYCNSVLRAEQYIKTHTHTHTYISTVCCGERHKVASEYRCPAGQRAAQIMGRKGTYILECVLLRGAQIMGRKGT